MVTEQTSELEAAAQELQGHVADLESRVEAANRQRDDVSEDVRSGRSVFVASKSSFCAVLGRYLVSV